MRRFSIIILIIFFSISCLALSQAKGVVIYHNYCTHTIKATWRIENNQEYIFSIKPSQIERRFYIAEKGSQVEIDKLYFIKDGIKQKFNTKIISENGYMLIACSENSK
ncbi:hypothetical protein [Aggregatibacter actinomycetemcomitans]|uniref:hypothetical protein n=1 Tax=Aggregatibacter actinomycetemcomitans TaxID=714 RepID=UPI00197B6812|nr:hypothetical protein [Aggregatibacter actinomycetemcomitans]MBN6064054.1 hypothetical protein [Aggregatibacter actinomycetemcomitans]MBN6082314.1 hypothetical protein [Aggregatibacter actinomycetemcomitans]MBN6083955.1 hypothetical protein [Aggregatibacter actinomycetemcomitans]